MYHELFGPRGAEDERDDFWTSIPEGGDMLPGMLPTDDRTEPPGAAQARRHAPAAGDLTPRQLDELRQALDPETPPAKPGKPGEEPRRRPPITGEDQVAHTPQGPAI